MDRGGSTFAEKWCQMPAVEGQMQVISTSHAGRISCQNASFIGEGDASRDGVDRLVNWWPAFQKDPVGVWLGRGRRICGLVSATAECALHERCRCRCAIIYCVFGEVELFVNRQGRGGLSCPSEGRIFRNICWGEDRISCQSGVKYTTT